MVIIFVMLSSKITGLEIINILFLPLCLKYASVNILSRNSGKHDPRGLGACNQDVPSM